MATVHSTPEALLHNQPTVTPLDPFVEDPGVGMWVQAGLWGSGPGFRHEDVAGPRVQHGRVGVPTMASAMGPGAGVWARERGGLRRALRPSNPRGPSHAHHAPARMVKSPRIIQIEHAN